MAKAQVNKVEIEFDTFGNPSKPALVLVMGLGLQMIAWPEAVCDEFAAMGFFVVRFDNRDCGLSTKFDSYGVPNIFAGLAGDRSTAPYSLADMADDTVALMDHLGVEAAHLVGVSMGGMIAQQAVIDHPTRFLSLCSMLSSTGAKGVGQPSNEVVAALLQPGGDDRDTAIERSLEISRAISSEKYFNKDSELELMARSYDRNYCPEGVMRQLMAVVTSSDRTVALKKVTIPTIVIHGLADRLVNPSGGIATASSIPDARLLAFEGMAHEVPESLWPEVRKALLWNMNRASSAG